LAFSLATYGNFWWSIYQQAIDNLNSICILLRNKISKGFGNYNLTFKYSRAHKKNLKISKGQAESKKDRQYSGQNKKDKSTNNDQQNIHIKLKIE